tara:strand:+ start:9279 stop:9983 length:705 start_codon:yes stop_codon:yes gene_type:complete
MTEELIFQTYLNLAQNKFEIYLFDTNNFKNLYKDEIIVESNIHFSDLSLLDKFLDKNIFKIEKLFGKFIKNIFIIIESKDISIISIGTKKKNYDEKINTKYIENIIKEAKELFVESHQDQKIMHIEIKNYLINGKYYTSFNENIKIKSVSLEVEFRSISNNYVLLIEKVLEKYQIKADRLLCKSYINDFFKHEEIGLSERIYRIIDGQNNNEVKLVPKKLHNKGFFERFFQFFS